MKNLSLFFAVTCLLFNACKKEETPLPTWEDVKSIRANSVTIISNSLDTSHVFVEVDFVSIKTYETQVLHAAWYQNKMPLTIDLQGFEMGPFSDTTFLDVSLFTCPGDVTFCPSQHGGFSPPFDKIVFPETTYCDDEYGRHICFDLTYTF